jgi:hypothetical protein
VGEDLHSIENGEVDREKVDDPEATPVGSSKTLGSDDEKGVYAERPNDADNEANNEMDNEAETTKKEGEREKGDTEATEYWQEGDKVSRECLILGLRFLD